MNEHCGTRGYMCGSRQALDETFPGAKSRPTIPALNDERDNGVFFAIVGDYVLVKVNGVCPNLENGACRLGKNCASRQLTENSY